jgi:hypothetical protein
MRIVVKVQCVVVSGGLTGHDVLSLLHGHHEQLLHHHELNWVALMQLFQARLHRARGLDVERNSHVTAVLDHVGELAAVGCWMISREKEANDWKEKTTTTTEQKKKRKRHAQQTGE